MTPLRDWLFLCKVLVRERQGQDVATSRDDGVSMRVATREDLLRAASELPDSLTVPFVDAAMQRDDVCFAAFHGGRMVSFVWRSFSVAPHRDGLWVRVEPPYWYTYKTYTHPSYRGRRLSGSLTLFGDRVCRDRNLRYGVGFIETTNRASMQANLRLGSRVVGYAGYIKSFGRVYPFRTRGVVPHTFRFYRRETRGVASE